jgi:ribosome-associated translation inhibitor RaiA
MNIQINTDNHIKGNAALIKKFSSTIVSKLNRMSDQITLVQVHLSDQNGDKKGKNDKRCMVEIRLEGHQPVVVTENAETLNSALNGAINKLISMINSINGRQRNQRCKRNKESATDIEFPVEQ